MNSYIKTILLLGILSVILITFGGLIGGRGGLYFAFFFSLVMNLGAYFYSDRLALAANRAKPLRKEEHPEVFNMVTDLAGKMKMPMPKMFITPAKQANAFATGRNPKNASVAVTSGILDILTKDELKGVLAHELAHVKNRDILISSIAAVLASTISFLANMSLFTPRDDEESPLGGIMGIVLAILVPIAAGVVQMAISRQREFGADETGAKIVGSGESLANALLAIDASAKRTPLNINPAYSSLYISNPLGNIKGSMMKLFSTHPPVEERVKRLRGI